MTHDAYQVNCKPGCRDCGTLINVDQGPAFDISLSIYIDFDCNFNSDSNNNTGERRFSPCNTILDSLILLPTVALTPPSTWLVKMIARAILQIPLGLEELVKRPSVHGVEKVGGRSCVTSPPPGFRSTWAPESRVFCCTIYLTMAIGCNTSRTSCSRSTCSSLSCF